jgi:DNA transformation protein and related proteins
MLCISKILVKRAHRVKYPNYSLGTGGIKCGWDAKTVDMNGSNFPQGAHNLRMTTSHDFASYCCDLLASTGPCVAKRMFGGFGISTEGLTLAILADLGDGEKLWLKGDDATRSRYEAAGCAIFTYPMKGVPRSMNYFSAPEEAMDSPDAMRPWAALALECALRARAGKPAAKKVVKKTTSKPTAKPAVKPPTKTVKQSTSKTTSRAASKTIKKSA